MLILSDISAYSLGNCDGWSKVMGSDKSALLVGYLCALCLSSSTGLGFYLYSLYQVGLMAFFGRSDKQKMC